MNIRRLWLKLALLCALVTAVSFALPFSLAYIWAETEPLVNTFCYIPPETADVEVLVHKTVRNTGLDRIGPGGFNFQLENIDTHEIITLTTDEAGEAKTTLTFADVDLGREHRYTLTEVNDGVKGMTYSLASYDIAVSLQLDDATNCIHASVTVNGAPVQSVVAEFENIYHRGSLAPLTGDDTPLLLCAALMLLSSAGMVVLARRRRTAQ